MNYQHAYHVGHISDVFKHIIVMQLLTFLQKKPTGLCYLETHAAKALYDLRDSSTQKTNAYKEGIDKLWSNPAAMHPAITDYLQLVARFNPDKTLHFYPGSGLIARQCLRDHDEEILCELQPDIYAALYAYFRRDKKVHVHHGDGYRILSSLLPPPLKRGLVLIDPAYEAADEYQHILSNLAKMYCRWPHGVYAIWFPIKEYAIIKHFYRELTKLAFENIIAAELHSDVTDANDNRLKGSGMVIVNPPWQFDLLLKKLLPPLAKALTIERDGKTCVQWIKRDSNK